MYPYHHGYIPSQMYPMMTMPEHQLEAMYPRVYYIVYPVVVGHCDMMDTTYGPSYIPTREQLEAMVDDIYARVERDVDAEIMKGSRELDERQFGIGRRNLLRSLISILLIRELISRRRRPFFGFPFFGGGFGF
ncbi:MAG TPA: hypothetical protein GXX14_00870 [Clostridiaceae bacterium]|nr:hypothetical protein [Clostridiaceae bacterium]